MRTMPTSALARPLLLGCLLGLSVLPGCATTVAPSGNASVSADLLEVPVLQDSSPAQDVRARQLFIRGMTRAYLDDHEGALALYEQAVRLTTSRPALLAAMAESYAALGDVPTALYFAQQAVTGAPDNPHYYHQLADLYLSTGQSSQAIERYEALLARFPNDVDALYALGRVQAAAGRLADALATYQQLRKQLGENPDLLDQMLRLQYQLEDTAGVIQTLQSLLAQQPYDTNLLRLLSSAYQKTGRTAEAIALIEEALVENPANVELTMALADLYRRGGDPTRAEGLLRESIEAEGATAAEVVEQAAAYFARADVDASAAQVAQRLLRRALARDPDHPEAALMLGRLLHHEANYAEAAPLLWRALEQNPRDLDLWHETASTYLLAGEHERAAVVADEGLMLFPGQINLLRLAGYAYSDGYQNEQALDRFTEALVILEEEAPSEANGRSELLASMALMHTRLQHPAAADSLYILALEADPDNASALNNFAYSLADHPNRLSEALGYARRAVALEPGNPSYLDTLGWLHFKAGDFEEAESWIGKAVATGQASALVLEHYGDVWGKLGDWTQARQHWQAALEQNPDNEALRRKLATHP